ncbi:glycosyltransferase family 4 protein [Christiangramia sp. ASW11-125]|uniref:glycosyltransferase family 4 protein n=1 Tax=Christiangramia sp. ASW11-125 TaxID=3400701 RepID=UPI003AADEE7A
MPNQKKRILVFIDWFLPGTNSGGPVRSVANLVDHLGEEFEFLIVTRDTDYCEEKPYNGIEANKWTTLGENCKVFYLSENNINVKYLKQLISNTEFKLAYVNGIYSRFFSIVPVRILKSLNKPVVVAARGMLNPQAFSVKPLKKKIFIEAAKLAGLHSKTIFHATNEEEKECIHKIFPYSKGILVAPNLPRKTEEGAIPIREKTSTTKLISVARVAKEKGTLTALKALFKSHSSENIIYDIYGPIYDQKYWQECKELIRRLPDNIQVNYKGSIESEEVPGIMKDYHFFLMPSEGENFGHGILEALTAACPVIISDKTPWTKLRKQKIGWDCSLDSGDLVPAIEKAVSMDQKEYDKWSKASFEFAKEYCNDPKAIEASRRLFEL